jgi:hypothetical protein
MSEQAGMPGELIYEHAVQIKQVGSTNQRNRPLTTIERNPAPGDSWENWRRKEEEIGRNRSC